MDNLLCDELWLTCVADHDRDHDDEFFGYLSTKEEFERGVGICLEKEMSYMADAGYADHLRRSQDLALFRFKAVQWLAKCWSRLRLSLGTVFNAVNYLDRFLSNSINQCNGWKYSTVQLVSVACLSVAAKFNETSSPSLHQIQMEGMSQVFDPAAIQRTELTVLDALGWRLSSTTPYSYVELLLNSNDHDHKLNSELNNLLLCVLLDPRLVGFRPCVVAISALKCGLQQLLLPTLAADHLALMTSLVPRNSKDDLVRCDLIVEGLLMEAKYNMDSVPSCRCPSSPVTVLLIDSPVDMILDDCVDDDHDDDIVPLFKAKKKRKREEE